jgi:type IV pilus assembly protein PilZ
VDDLFSEFTQNINEGGLFIETEQPLALDEQVQMHFRLPGTETPVKVSGRVAWVSDGASDGTPGMGIEFEHLDDDARRQINRLVQRLRVERNL